MKIILLILILAFYFSAYGQVETINNFETKANFIQKINANKSLFQNYINRTLGISDFPANFGSADIYDLNNLFDTLNNRLGFNSDIDAIYYGSRGRMLRNTINNNFSSLENDVSDGNNSWYYIITASLTDSIEVEALKYLYFALIDSALINKMHVVYPIIGGTAETHKYNLGSPYDADSSYRLTFGGTVTHDALGIKGNGTTGYGDTHYSLTDTTSIHVSFYSQTDSIGGQDVEIAVSVTDDNYFKVGCGYGAYYYFDTPETSYLNTSIKNNNSKGHYAVTLNDTLSSIFIEGVKVGMTEYNLSVVPDSSLYIMAENSYKYGAWQESPKQLSLVTIGEYLTDDENYTLSSIVRKYQSILNRIDTVQGRYIGSEVSEYPIELVTLGYDYMPKTARTPLLETWLNFNVGAMFDYQGRTYYAELWDNYTHSPYVMHPDTTHIDMGKWIAPIDSVGVDYAILTVFESTGFSLVPTNVPFPERLLDKFGGYKKYDTELNPWLDTSLFRSFIDTCEVYGIEPIPYVNPMRNFNLQGAPAFAHQVWDSIDCVHYNNWLAAYIQELMINYDFKFIWLDGWLGNELDKEGKAPVTDFRLLYNSIKAIDTSCLVIMNELLDTTMIRFPYDIGSSEQAVINGGSISDADLADTTRTYSGVDYFVPKEFIMTPRINEEWYARGIITTSTYLKSQSDIQDFYDRAKAVGANFCLAILVCPDGYVNYDQWEIWRNMVW